MTAAGYEDANDAGALRRHIADLEESTAKRFKAGKGGRKVRRFKEFHDGAASWTRVERIIARVEVCPQMNTNGGRGTRFIVTSLPTGSPAEALMRLALDRLPTLAPG